MEIGKPGIVAIAVKRLFRGPLHKHEGVVYESGSNTRTIVDTWFARAGLSLKPAMELESVEESGARQCGQ
jgi:hypothetical protein